MASVPRLQALSVGALAALLVASQAPAQDRRAPGAQKARAAAESAGDKASVEKSAEADAKSFCAAVAPSIAEARIAWQAKRLAELDAQVRRRIADLEKAEADARDWIAKRDALMGAASDDVVAIYAKMEAEAAARQLSAMDDRMAAAILGKLKPNAASAILDEMEAERASRLVGIVSAANAEGKKS
jgi:flagellar motility protein MotE (MotC chaperone)